MPKLTPKEFLKRVGRPKRWCFTASELEHPEKCLGTDEFIAGVGEELGVIVQRDGTVTNRWEDGSFGVTPEAWLDADSADTLFSPNHWEHTDCWRNVMTDAEGVFIRFVDERADEAQLLTDRLIEGSAADFIKGTRPPMPQFAQDVVEMGWQLIDIGSNRTHFQFEVEGFYLFGALSRGGVRLTAALHGGQGPGSDLISVVVYDHAAWEPPIGCFQVYWQTVKPFFLIWYKTLVFNLPADDASTLPSFQDWKRNWNQLREDLRARQWEEP